MIIKMIQSDGSVRLFDRVLSPALHSGHHIQYPFPPTYLSKEPEKLHKWIEERVARPSKNHTRDLVLGVSAEELPISRKVYFSGSFEDYAENEEPNRFGYKLLGFLRDKEEIWIYSEHPIYICNDEGKTIDVVK